MQNSRLKTQKPVAVTNLHVIIELDEEVGMFSIVPRQIGSYTHPHISRQQTNRKIRRAFGKSCQILTSSVMASIVHHSKIRLSLLVHVFFTKRLLSIQRSPYRLKNQRGPHDGKLLSLFTHKGVGLTNT